MHIVATPPGHRQLVDAHLHDVEQEVDAELRLLSGRIPVGLDGVWWRNGPGRFGRGQTRYGHPFDGDGLIVRMNLGPTEARVRTRFVRTPELIAEERAGRILYRGFGTDRPGGIAANAFRFQFKNVANTSVTWHAGRLRALWEGGAPTALDPHTLETLGIDDLGGVLRARGLAPPTFSAHPRIDRASGTLWNFGLRWGLRQQLTIYAIDASGVARIERTLALDHLTFIHDFAITPRWFVFLLPAVRFDVARMALGLSAPARSLRAVRDAPMIALLVPRDGGPPLRVPTVPGFVFHIAGAFEDDHGRIVCDALRLDGVPDLSDLDSLFGAGREGGLAEPLRLIIDPETRRVVQTHRLGDVAAELPVTAVAAGQPYRSIWATAVVGGGRQPYHSSIIRFEPVIGEVARRDVFPAIPSEPCFVRHPEPRHAEDGWILTVIHHPGAAAELWVLDATTLDVVTRLGLPAALPPGFHGCWADRPDVPEA